MTEASSVSLRQWQEAFRRTEFAKSYPYRTPKKGEVRVNGTSVRLVLYALSTWASFGTGQRAFPGVLALSTATGMNAETISRCLSIGREMGWVTRTSIGARGTGKADEYALTIPSDTAGTHHSPVESVTAGTGTPTGTQHLPSASDTAGTQHSENSEDAEGKVIRPHRSSVTSPSVEVLRPHRLSVTAGTQPSCIDHVSQPLIDHVGGSERRPMRVSERDEDFTSDDADDLPEDAVTQSAPQTAGFGPRERSSGIRRYRGSRQG